MTDSIINPNILMRLRTMQRMLPTRRYHIGEMAYGVYNYDACRFLSRFPDESVDLIFTDEPFGCAHTKIEVKGRKSPLLDTMFDWDEDMPLSLLIPWVYEAYRVLKPGGALLNCGFPEWATGYRDVCRDAGFYWKATVAQIISNPRPQARKANFRSSHYNLWWASKGKPKTFNFQEQQEMRNWQGETICPSCQLSVPMVFSNQYDWPEWIFSARELGTIWTDIGPLGGAQSNHPTKKPEWLAYKYINIFTEEGDVVVDPFVEEALSHM
jgi:DNA modification methylase